MGRRRRGFRGCISTDEDIARGWFGKCQDNERKQLEDEEGAWRNGGGTWWEMRVPRNGSRRFRTLGQYRT